MNNYLGEFDVDINDTPFKDYTALDWVDTYICAYGGIDGSHHKTWVLDQCLRICRGTPVILKEARWGTTENIEYREYRWWTDKPSEEYTELVESWKEEYGEHDVGIAP